ncbi:MAG TPA: NADH-quinone oxidoreductase subunit M, partial [Alphaproteobacteria bacterium]|nr:NADH-quinone oxidoreductase subunit M [Alphaproteobacteria bacterium]
NTWVAALAAIGVILGAAYMLWLYRRVIFGELTKESLKDILDLDKREIAIFAPLVIVVLWMGIYPSSFLDAISASAQNLADNYQAALKAAQAPASQAMAAGGAP